jgi:hypothetical protein
MVVLSFEILGSFLSLIGSIMTACSVGKNSQEIHYKEANAPEKKTYLAVIEHPELLKWGIRFLMIGFFLIIIQTVLVSTDSNKYELFQKIEPEAAYFTVFNKSNGNISFRAETTTYSSKLVFKLGAKGIIETVTKESFDK